MISFIVLSVFLATAFGVMAVFLWLEGRKESLPRRVEYFVSGGTKPGRTAYESAKEWTAGFWKRFISRTPGREEFLALFTGKELSGAHLLLSQAGYRKLMSYRLYVWVKMTLPVFFLVVAILFGELVGLPGKTEFLLGILGMISGLLLPGVWLRGRVRNRREEIEDALPDGLDLLSVCVDAGLGINSAFVRLTDEFRLTCMALSEEFDIVNREMIAGKPRQEALRALADRTGVEDVKSFVGMLIQTEKLGTSLSQSLRVHADSLRTKRRQRAEEAAAKTTIKLVFPLVLLLFPALFIIVLGPGLIQVIRVLLPAVKG
ncbi:MAG: type II secretion system F family protein [Candidatus Deferrimicrobiaceae bacterium]